MKTFIRTHRSQNGWRQELNIYYMRGASAAENAATQLAKTYFCGGNFFTFYLKTTLTLTLTLNDRHSA